MIYLDSSVALVQLFAENRFPPQALAASLLTSSRLLEYEVWNRIHARRLTATPSDAVAVFFDYVSLIDLTPAVLARARSPFPIAVRTLDGLHLATVEFLRMRGHDIELASYDRRLIAGARALGISIYAL